MGDDDDVMLARNAKNARADAGVPVPIAPCTLTQFFFDADRNQRNESAAPAITRVPNPFSVTSQYVEESP